MGGLIRLGLAMLNGFRKHVTPAPRPAQAGPRIFCERCRNSVTVVDAVRTLLASGHWAWSGACPQCQQILHKLIPQL